MATNLSHLSPLAVERQFKMILLDISHQLQKSELDTMMEMFAGEDGYPGYAQIEKVKNGFQFFMMLVKMGKISHCDYKDLLFLLDCVNRQDLKRKFFGQNVPYSAYIQQPDVINVHMLGNDNTIMIVPGDNITVNVKRSGDNSTVNVIRSDEIHELKDKLERTEKGLTSVWKFMAKHPQVMEMFKESDEWHEQEQFEKIYEKAAKGNYHALVEMLCKECNAYITKVSCMIKRGCYITCIDPDINERIELEPYTRADRYRDSETIGVFKCANPTCGQKLGIAVNFLDDESRSLSLKGYGFGVKSFCFKFADGTKKSYKQWRKVPRSITVL